MRASSFSRRSQLIRVFCGQLRSQAARMFRTRHAVELKSTLPLPEILIRVCRYVEDEPNLVELPAVKVVDGSVGEDTFTILYAGPYGEVRVAGTVHPREGHSSILLRFREEHPSILRVFLTACGAACVGYLFHMNSELLWLQWAMPLPLALLFLVLPRHGTSQGFAEAVSDELSTTLLAERVRIESSRRTTG